MSTKNKDIRKILLLGGSYGQFPAIYEAKKRGYYTLLCDYLTDNPGQHYVDKYIPASTTDTDAILSIAKENKIDAILGYASDPATYTSSVVSQLLNLPGNKPSSIELLTHKGHFRNLQKNIGLPTPAFELFSLEEIERGSTPSLDIPFVVKPVDSSDTKGVFLISQKENFTEKAREAIKFSRCGTLIAETFIGTETANLHGDGFILDGKPVFIALGKVMFYSKVNALKPTATWYPGDIEKRWLDEAESQIEGIMEAAGFENGPINIEARVDREGELYIMEIGPRSGGGMTPQTIAYAYGFDMLGATFDLLERKKITIHTRTVKHTLLMTMHVNQSGRVIEISKNTDLEPYLVESFLSVKGGDMVKSYDQPGSSLGAYIYQFENDQLLIKNQDKLYDTIINQIKIQPNDLYSRQDYKG